MKQQDTIDLTNLDYLFNQFDFSEQTEDLDKIRVAKKIMRIRNGTYEFDDELEYQKLMGDPEFLRAPSPITNYKPEYKTPIRIYEDLKLAPIKLSKSCEKLKKPRHDEFKSNKKYFTFELEEECDLSVEDIIEGDTKMKMENKLVFLRFFGEAKNINLWKHETNLFNAIDFFDKDKQDMLKITSLTNPKYFKNYYYQKNKSADLRFLSNFLGGNLWKVYQVGENEYDVYTSVESNSFHFNYWFFFKVLYIGNKKQKSIRVNIRNTRLAEKNGKVSIWHKRAKFGESVYAKYRKKTKNKNKNKKGKKVEKQPNNIWLNSIKGQVSFNTETEEKILSFDITIKKQEEVMFSLSYPYFITDFFTDLKIHSHPLFNPYNYTLNPKKLIRTRTDKKM